MLLHDPFQILCYQYRYPIQNDKTPPPQVFTGTGIFVESLLNAQKDVMYIYFLYQDLVGLLHTGGGTATYDYRYFICITYKCTGT